MNAAPVAALLLVDPESQVNDHNLPGMTGVQWFLGQQDGYRGDILLYLQSVKQQRERLNYTQPLLRLVKLSNVRAGQS